MYSNCTVGYILSLGVCSSFRRQGVASLLLDSFLTHVTQSENQICKAIYLHVLTMNSAAIRFYEKHYFRYSFVLTFGVTCCIYCSLLGYTRFCRTTIPQMASVKMDLRTYFISMEDIPLGGYYILFSKQKLFILKFYSLKYLFSITSLH